jgi:hypothetical protein
MKIAYPAAIPNWGVEIIAKLNGLERDVRYLQITVHNLQARSLNIRIFRQKTVRNIHRLQKQV